MPKQSSFIQLRHVKPVFVWKKKKRSNCIYYIMSNRLPSFRTANSISFTVLPLVRNYRDDIQSVHSENISLMKKNRMMPKLSPIIQVVYTIQIVYLSRLAYIKARFVMFYNVHILWQLRIHNIANWSLDLTDINVCLWLKQIGSSQN